MEGEGLSCRAETAAAPALLPQTAYAFTGLVLLTVAS